MGLGNRRRGTAHGQTARFGSVTVLNGHIHQIVRKVEGNVTFHTGVPPPIRNPRPGSAPTGASQGARGPARGDARRHQRLGGETPGSLVLSDTTMHAHERQNPTMADGAGATMLTFTAMAGFLVVSGRTRRLRTTRITMKEFMFSPVPLKVRVVPR